MNGILKFGIKKSDAVFRDWTCFDSFRLFYYGKEFEDDTSTGIGKTIDTDVFEIYTLGGQKVRHQATSIKGLPKGVYVVAGKKVVVK